MTNPNSRVYFVEAVGLGLVKIGYSVDIPNRMKGIRTGELDGSLSGIELRLIGTITGDKFGEHIIHRHFAVFRVRGEWFDADAARPFIEDICKMTDEQVNAWFDYHRRKEQPTGDMLRRQLLNREDRRIKRERQARSRKAA